jgi:hypothetical protein
MNFRFYFVVGFICIAAFSVIIWLTYCAGSGSGTFVGAKTVGWLLGFLGTIVFIVLGKRKKFEKLIGFVFFVAVMLILQCCCFNLLLRVYAAGFERAIFRAGTPTEWDSLVQVAQKWISGSSQKSDFAELLPPFVRNVYPGKMPYSGISGDNARNISVSLFWRGPTVSIGLNIGAEGHFYKELYRKRIRNDMSIAIFRGG